MSKLFSHEVYNRFIGETQINVLWYYGVILPIIIFIYCIVVGAPMPFGAFFVSLFIAISPVFTIGKDIYWLLLPIGIVTSLYCIGVIESKIARRVLCGIICILWTLSFAPVLHGILY